MALFLTTGPASEPITTTEAKLHLRVDADDDDDLIDALIQAAREHVETFTGRALMTQTWDLKLASFYDCAAYDSDANVIWLPKPPVQSVTSVTYLDSNGDSQTWTASSTGYLTDLPTDPKGQRARIYPAYAISYPTTRTIQNAVTIRFVSGYASAAAVPESIKAAMKLLIGTWYEQRAHVATGVNATEIPQTVNTLLWPYKAF